MLFTIPTQSTTTNRSGVLPPIDGCNIVANSPYARVANVPLGYFGFIYYLYMLGLTGLLAYDPLSRGMGLGALLYAALGVCFSIYFMYIQITFIHAFCIYCLVSAVLTLLLFICAVWHFGRSRRFHFDTRGIGREISPVSFEIVGHR
jgi:uncharacterized membrane protein